MGLSAFNGTRSLVPDKTRFPPYARAMVGASTFHMVNMDKEYRFPDDNTSPIIELEKYRNYFFFLKDIYLNNTLLV